MVMDTTDPGYRLNWRFVLCATWVYSCMALACYLIWKYEGPSLPAGNDEGSTERRRGPGSDSELCILITAGSRPLMRSIMLGCWLFALCRSCLWLRWTFLLVTLYFGLGSMLSIYGCYQYACKMDKSDADRGSYIIAPMEESTYDNSTKSSCLNKTHDGREIAGFWGYLFQIMFQTNAGAVMLTDMVFWFILYPFLAWNQYQMSFAEAVSIWMGER
ncbi:hypothetical protein ZWY2020_016114 [Hordeum vulgare]|nr:hypothetical protein ZWY2020_016114 [Hordeum vulgare]